MISICRLLFAFVVLSPSAFSQEQREVKCRFLSFGQGLEKSSVLAVTKDGAEIPCSLPTDSISKPVSCFAINNTLTFVSPDDGAKVATVSVPRTVSAALLVFLKKEGDENQSAWNVMLIEDTKKNFPDGGAYVVNFHKNEVGVVIGEHKGKLKAAQKHGFAMPKTRDSFNMAPVVFKYQMGEKWKTANESALRFLPGIRYLIFAYPDPRLKRVKIRTYLDRIPKQVAVRKS